MGYLRLVRTAPAPPTKEDPCVTVFHAELDYIFETLRRLGARPGEIEDLAHDVFLVLHRNWPTLDTARPMRPYIFGVAFRIVSSQRRRHARESPYSSLEREDEAPSPELQLQTSQSIALLLAALERVPLARRAVVIMHDLDGIPVLDIARTLDISRFGTYARLRKGRNELAAAVRLLRKDSVAR